MVTRPVPLVCVGGPLSGETIHVVPAPTLPPALNLPYWPEGAQEAESVLYRVIAVALFGRRIHFLVYDSLARGVELDVALVEALLRPSVANAWKAADPDGD